MEILKIILKCIGEVWNFKMHLIFSFSSPLVNTLSSGKQFALPQLNFNKEFEQIENALYESRTDLKYK